jgi:hypothetical protein
LRIFSREANFSFVFGLSTGTPSGTNWIKTKENFASREKIRKWKTGFSGKRPYKLCFFYVSQTIAQKKTKEI